MDHCRKMGTKLPLISILSVVVLLIGLCQSQPNYGSKNHDDDGSSLAQQDHSHEGYRKRRDAAAEANPNSARNHRRRVQQGYGSRRTPIEQPKNQKPSGGDRPEDPITGLHLPVMF